MDILKTGWLRKNRKGKAFGANGGNLRYFVSQGFHVRYYKGRADDGSPIQQTGKFDLRNVTKLSSISVGAMLHVKKGITFTIKDKPGDLIISYDNMSSVQAEQWTTLWTSAVDPVCLDVALKPFREEILALKIDTEGATMEPLGARKSSVSPVEVASPRSRPSGEAKKLLETNEGAATTIAAAQRGKKARASQPSKVSSTHGKSMQGSMQPATGSPTQVSSAHGKSMQGIMQPATGSPTQIMATLSEEDTTICIVYVPAYARSGDKLRVSAHNGANVIIPVPEGARPGNALEFLVPPAPKSLKATEPSSRISAPTAPKEKTLEQRMLTSGRRPVSPLARQQMRRKSICGNNERRLLWMKYLVCHDVAQFDEALKIAITDEEKQHILDIKAATEHKHYKLLLAMRMLRELGPCLSKCFSKLEEKAVIKIEGNARGFLARKAAASVDAKRMQEQILANSTPDQEVAAAMMQGVVRGHQVRTDIQEQRRLEWLAYYQHPDVADYKAALDLCVTKKEAQQVIAKHGAILEEKKQDAIRSQSWAALLPCLYKCFGAREQAAASVVQSHIRGRNGRKVVEEKERQNAATTVQARLRGNNARMLPKHEAAAAVQSVHRGNISRQENTRERHEAAAVLQSVTRGHSVRTANEEKRRSDWLNYYSQPDVREWEKAKELCVTEDENKQVDEAKAQYLKVKKEKAIKAQKKCFGNCKAYGKAEEYAAGVLQRTYRGFKGRKEAEEVPKRTAATTVQSHYRGKKAREEATAKATYTDPEHTDSAIKMQSRVRGNEARKKTAEVAEDRRRKEWIEYYSAPYIGNWERALELCYDLEEEKQVFARKEKWQWAIDCFGFN